MKILVVASFNRGSYAPFIVEQAEALRRAGCDIEFYGVTGKGIAGYLKAFPAYRRKIKAFEPDVIHAHYGLSGLFANLQRCVPVVTTYHGSDINKKSVLPFSKLAMALSKFNIFVSQRTVDIAKPRKNFSLIPCGVDLNDLQLTSKTAARDAMGLNAEKKYVLFAGAFDNSVKNYPLARSAMALLPEAELLELKGYSREQVTLLMCAADAFLMTSFTEGSPQVVKEAMVCGCPIVSVDVGDVKDVISCVDRCAIAERSAGSLAEALLSAMGHGRTDGRKKIMGGPLLNDNVAERILSIYKSII